MPIEGVIAEQAGARLSDQTPLDPEQECRVKERQRNDQGGVLSSCDSYPRSRVALS